MNDRVQNKIDYRQTLVKCKHFILHICTPTTALKIPAVIKTKLLYMALTTMLLNWVNSDRHRYPVTFLKCVAD